MCVCVHIYIYIYVYVFCGREAGTKLLGRNLAIRGLLGFRV